MLSCPPPSLDSFRFNPAARIYNLRILLLVTLALIPITVIYVPSPGPMANNSSASSYNYNGAFLGVLSSALIFVHQFGRLFRTYLNAVYDWFLCLISIISAVVYLGVFSSYLLQLDAVGPSITLITRVIQLAALILSTIWTTATIRKSREKITRQRFEFLGGCGRSETYRVSRILLNRSASRPLVRSKLRREVHHPANFRHFLWLCQWSPTSLRGVSVNQHNCVNPEQPQNVNILETSDIPVPPNYAVGLWQCPLATNSTPFDFTASTFLFTQSEVPVNGSEVPVDGSEVSVNGTWVPTTSRRDVLYVQIGKGDNFNDMIQYTDPISLFPGTHLAATLTWTQRKVVTLGLSSLLGPIVPSKAVLIAEVHALRVDPRYNAADFFNSSSTLSIVQTRVDPTRFIQEYADSSAIAGLATVGGFWTFVDGTFVLFFGANILYFLVGRRPLSALGIVHFFQRRRLVQQWHEDFPALHTEGGRPGSEQAGIVAFLRERFVDVEGQKFAGETDSEAQKKPSDIRDESRGTSISSVNSVTACGGRSVETDK
ncbi:hypothetical protein B0H19DRAFT_297214 [Mycena capillaripes]|nr:hypothetical protein B0H19DRAFT_297214 [Mycena capillaripes]